MRSIAILGGTFDPVHTGHLQTSLNIQSLFNFDTYYFLPCKIPALKPPAFANNQQRIDMLELAIKGHPKFKIDLREINRDSPSYMVETLQSFRSEYQNASITLILGYDSLLSLSQWHQWKNIIKLANLLVINRHEFSNCSIPKEIATLIESHLEKNNNNLLKHKAGLICFFDAGNYEISSSDIRDKLKQQKSVNSNLPKEVYEYIKQWELYQ